MHLFFANFLIALREGVEAALIVGIIIGYLAKIGRTDLFRPVWTGVIGAAAIPLALGAFMTWGPYTLTFQAQEILGGVLSIVAVAFITWMIFWMAANSSRVAAEIKEGATAAIASGNRWGLVWLAALAVGREGIETAIFVWATVKSANQGGVWEPTLGVLAGLGGAIVIGWLVYRGTTRINLRLFFLVTGYLLIFVAAGVLGYGVGDFQEASLLPGWGVTVYDLVPVSAAATWWFVLLNAMFNIQYLLSPTHLQLAAWLAYLLPTLALFALRIHQKTKPATSNLPVAAKTI